MKNLILFPFLLLSLCVFAQSEYEKNYFIKPFNDTFKNESVVIARMMEESTYTPYGMLDYKVTVVFRAQYILKDISALNNFSTLYKNNDLKRYELKQIKPNGKVNVIYEYFDKNYPDDGYDKLIDEDDEDEKKQEEIPLEGIEIGDIIDYKYEFTFTTKNKDFRKVLIKNGKFDKVPTEVNNYNQYKFLLFKNKFIKNSYPIASSVVVINVPDELKLIQKTLNSDYKFTSKSASGKTTYECILDLINSYKSEEFSYSYLHHPVIKFGLVQTNSEKQAWYPYQFKSENISMEDVAAIGMKMYKDKLYIPKYLFYLNTQSSDNAYKEVSLSKFFSTFLKTFTKKDKNKLIKLNKLHEYLTNNDKLNEKPFGEIGYAVIMARFCDKIGIKYKMMACLHKYDGEWKDLLSPYEITWGLYIPNKGKDIFITSYEKESNIFQRFGSLSGTELVLINTKDAKNVFSTMKYPEVSGIENLYEQHSEIVFSDDTAYEYTFVNNYTIKGNQKYVISSYIKNQFDHERLRTPYKFFGLVNYNEVYNWKEFTTNEEWFEEYSRLDSAYRTYFKDYYSSRMLGFLYNEYDFDDITIDSNRISQDGDYKDEDSVTYAFKAVFKVKGLLINCNSDSTKILNLGRLMTEQYQISNYQVENRFCDVYNSNLREIRWVNSIELPEGYTCVNLDDFNLNFENEAGIFKTTAVIEDGVLIFKVEKIYKTHYLPKEKWMEMVHFLQTAERMYMKKLLLQKK